VSSAQASWGNSSYESKWCFCVEMKIAVSVIHGDNIRGWYNFQPWTYYNW